jgi:hypothetical protein
MPTHPIITHSPNQSSQLTQSSPTHPINHHNSPNHHPLTHSTRSRVIIVTPITHQLTLAPHRHPTRADEPWFRDAFTNIAGVEYHIAKQAAYWIDAFGGGRQYHGGDGRVNFHHHHNASSVMNAAGARRWMHHMSHALNYDIDWFVNTQPFALCIISLPACSHLPHAHACVARTAVQYLTRPTLTTPPF